MTGHDPEIWLGHAPAPLTVVHYLAEGDAEILRPLLSANLGAPVERTWNELSDDERNNVAAVAGTNAMAFARELGRPLRAVAVIRDPVTQAVSLDPPPPNEQSRRLLEGRFDTSELPVDPSSDEAALWHKRLDEAVEDYRFLVEGWLLETTDALIEAFGWRFSLPGPLKARGRIDLSSRTAVAAANWLDAALFERLVSASRSKAKADKKSPYRAKVNQQRDPKLKGEMTPLDLYLAPESLEPHLPINVFHHISKTAGTAFRTLLYNNLGDRMEFRALRIPRRDIPGSNVAVKAYGDAFRDLSEDDRSRLVWVAAQTASFSLSHLDRPVLPVTAVREPLDRVLSRYYFAGNKEKRAERNEGGLEEIFTPTRADSRARRPDYMNGQSRSVLQPYYDVDELRATPGPPADADLWRERLREIVDGYVLLVQDQLARSVRLLGPQWGLDTTKLSRVRVNRDRPAGEDVSDGVRELVYAYNWLDLELYQLACTRLGAADAAVRAQL